LDSGNMKCWSIEDKSISLMIRNWTINIHRQTFLENYFKLKKYL
jgi:hypothetical protein